MPSDELELRRPPANGRRPKPGPGTARPAGLQPRPTGTLETWAHLDPTGLSPRLVRVARLVPGVSAVEHRVLAPLEARLLQVLFSRASHLLERERIVPAPPRDVPLSEVIEDATDQTPRAVRDQLFDTVLSRLVHDELRILGALADGTVFPLVNVTAPRRTDDTPVLTNASTVGRVAGVAVPERTPVYVTNLLHLGLARVGPADDNLGYDRLLTEPEVAAARREADDRRRLRRARIERRTLRVTEFGHELWESR